MIAIYTEPVRTVLPFEGAANALRWALQANRVADVRDDQLALALAKTALETGRWKSVWNHNFGNIKASESYAGQFTCIRLNEVIGGKLVWFNPDSDGHEVPPGHPQTRLRAYANEFDGADDYIAFVAGSKRYAKAWVALLEGDPAKYVHELKKGGYFTADEQPYRKAVVNLYSEFLARLRNLPATEYQDDWDELRARVESQQFGLEDLLGLTQPERVT